MRFQSTFGGAEPATWVLFFALSARIFTIFAFLIALWRGREIRARLAVDLLVLVTAPAVIIVGTLFAGAYLNARPFRS